MDTYRIWTVGCQMNKADSERLGSALDQLGLKSVDNNQDADIVVLNSCVVRQSAEDRVIGNLNIAGAVKKKNPGQVVALMGCMVGAQTDQLKKKFPYVDLFMRPQEYSPLLDMVGESRGLDWEGCVGSLAPSEPNISTYVPIIHGCDLMCTFCIIPYRRGRQVSRPVEDVGHEIELLVQRGVKEVTVLGQTVDAYGLDLPGEPDLSDLFVRLNSISDLERIRFLTSHPSFMTQRIIDSVKDLTKVCEHINLPVQSGDDEILGLMRRPYSRSEYIELVSRIRDSIPNVSISTDLIVGFPGETPEQYENSLDLVRELKFDKVHCAAYSTRPGTIADRTMVDNVPQDEKVRRLKEVDSVQEDILRQINSKLVGNELEVLVEGQKNGRWQSRTRTDKIVFFDHDNVKIGDIVNVTVESSTAWSLQATPIVV
ncbi:MAG: tRNA (N6-isopentenyl adenosine(37)-C2)-methylthiotransferase MiaB [Dehalococcoidia bacterium]|mgnify:CR=1 FL=1|nr:tRNA (N6-isopentenyl adenosine(37)-C2)-methylthiotransferase MiaB [Dehalococcoidia bacterium]